MSLKIEIEGTDGAGKTTGLKYFIEQLTKRGKKVLETREVGSPLIPINVGLRKLVLNPESNLSGEAMELIFSAMRFENDRLYKAVGKYYDFIVSDRGWLSHLAYTDHNVSPDLTKKLYLDFMQQQTDMPDIVVYFDVSSDTALKRRIKRNEAVDVIEAKGVEYQDLVRQSFNKHIKLLTTYSPKTTVLTIDANQPLENVYSQLSEIVDKLVEGTPGFEKK